METKKNLEIESQFEFTNGNSFGNAIVIKKGSFIDNYVNKEYAIIDNIESKQNQAWKVLLQELIFKDGKTFDILTIETRPFFVSDKSEKKIYYFNITDCYTNRCIEKDIPEEEQLLAQIVDRVQVLIIENRFSKDCVAMLKEGSLKNDSHSLMEFLDVIWEDEYLPLFKTMQLQYGKPMMDLIGPISAKLRKRINQ